MEIPRTQPVAPPAVETLARRRAEARAARDWPAADKLRVEIEAAGWKVIDQGLRFRLEPAHSPDVTEAGRVRYGSSEAVPSRLNEPPTARASVVLLADRWPEDLARTLDGLRRHAPDGTQVVVVANDPTPEQTDQLEAPTGPAMAPIADLAPEQVWTSAPLGQAAAQNAGIRRATGEVVILLDTSVEPTGDLVTPLVEALEDPRVAVTGGWGLRSRDLRHFEPAGPGDVDAIDGRVLAFRRADYFARGPLDERFRYSEGLDIWWSLVLRDAGGAGRHRRAVPVDLPAVRHPHRGATSLAEPERDRLSRRNRYRILDRFGGRHDLLIEPAPPAPRAHPAG